MKDRYFIEEIETTLSCTGEIAYSLFKEITRESFAGLAEHHHARISRGGVVKLLIFMKMLKIETINQYFRSDLGKLIRFGKDVFYTIKNNAKMDWRQCLLTSAYECSQRKDGRGSTELPHQVPCFIIDDSDHPHRGKCIEFIGRIFSHVGKGSILGFKSLNLALWTGVNVLHLDFSLHGESGKKGDQGMGKKR